MSIVLSILETAGFCGAIGLFIDIAIEKGWTGIMAKYMDSMISQLIKYHWFALGYVIGVICSRYAAFKN